MEITIEPWKKLIIHEVIEYSFEDWMTQIAFSSKTAGGAIWLEESMTSAYEFFQFWLNSDDADMPKLLKVFSMRSRAEIEELIEKVKQNKKTHITVWSAV